MSSASPPGSRLAAVSAPPQPVHRILLVDDEPGILRMFKGALRNYGFVTEEASDGAEALARLAKTPFDVVVSDINMPGHGGLQFLRSVRELDLDVPVILMTGRPSLESSNLALEYGAFQYLIKPVMPAALKEVLERAVRLHEIARLRRKAVEVVGGEAKWLGDRAALEARFGKAMEGLWMAYQPIVSVSERRVFGYEALLRTSEPTLLNPCMFLQAAERLGRLEELGRAIRTKAAVLPPDHAKLFVNLNASDLNDENLYLPTSALAKIADRVVLEITERASLDAVKGLESRVARLRRLGFQIAVDDLGAGYAGLASFTQLEPRIAKLDMSLIRGIDSQPKKQSIVRSMQKLCSELSVVVVAEGVETAPERDTLAGLGCNLLQGYFFAKPGVGFPIPRW